MSRFFHGSDSSSESSSDEEELYSEEEEKEKKSDEESDEEKSEEEEDSDEDSSDDEEAGAGANRFLKRDAFLKSDEEDSEDEEKVTVVKSAKDKRYEELEGTVRLIENAERISDWAVIQSGRYLCSQRLAPGLY